MNRESSSREEDLLVVGGVARLDADAWRRDAEEDERVRAELLQHVDRHDDAGRRGAASAPLSKASGRTPEDDALDTGRRPPRRVEADAELPEDDLVSLDARVDEVHRGRADERRHEEVGRILVETLRRVDLDDPAVAHDGDALAERHRLRLVVGDVDARDREAGVQLRERGAHPDAELRVEVRERLVHEDRPWARG